MIVQEPVQAAIWHCLNHYDYSDAIFLSERLHAEVNTDESLFLLSTSYYRSGQKDFAYHKLKARSNSSPQCRYLLASCAYELEKYHEAEAAICDNLQDPNNVDEIIADFGDQAAFVLLLLGKIAAKTARNNRAIEMWRRSLKINPFLWSSFEHLCRIGDKPNPQNIFQINNCIENMSLCHGSNINNSGECFIIMNNNNTGSNTNTTPNTQEVNAEPFITTPQQIFSNKLVMGNTNSNSKLCTPDESPLAQPLPLSGVYSLSSTNRFRLRMETVCDSPQPSFGQLFDNSLNGESGSPTSLVSQPTLTESNNHQSLAKRMRAHLFQNCKPVFSQSTNVPVTKTPTIPLAGIQAGGHVRRSSRLFSNSYSVKENNKSPSSNKSKFATPKSPSQKTKRIAKCNLNKNVEKTYSELNTRNKITSLDNKDNKESTTAEKPNENCVEKCIQQAMHLQKQSADGLMNLLRDIGQGFIDLTNFECQSAIDQLNNLPRNQLNTPWVYSLIGLAYFEMAQYEMSVKYFSEVHNMEPYRLPYMDIYSTALWHLQKEVALSALAQDLINLNKNSPITWCVSGNCFSLHKEHDTAIKFFQRAVQVDPNFPYAYTLLGHEYITTEELDKAMSCFRNAIRLDPRHYNAWFGIGTIYSKQERYEVAERNYMRALAINPRSSVILCHIGVIQHALKDTEKALATFNTAIANNPRSPLCKFHRGSIYFALGRHAEALKELEELKEIVPKESVVYYLIGKVHKKLGNTDLALMHFSWATELDPKGASSQIKEAFDPAIGRSSAEMESPTSPTPDDYHSETNNSAQQADAIISLNDMRDDSSASDSF